VRIDRWRKAVAKHRSLSLELVLVLVLVLVLALAIYRGSNGCGLSCS
jgi:hypothetical protein